MDTPAAVFRNATERNNIDRTSKEREARDGWRLVGERDILFGVAQDTRSL